MGAPDPRGTWFRVYSRAVRQHVKFRDLTLSELGAWLVLRSEADLMQADRFADRREALLLLSRHEDVNPSGTALEKLLAVGLLDELPDGGIAIHDLADHHRQQYPSDSAEATRLRKAAERERKGTVDVTRRSRGVTSRGSGEEKREKSSEKNPTLSLPQTAIAPISATTHPQPVVGGSRPDVAYLMSCGWARVTPRQLQVLDGIGSNERRTERDVRSGQQWCADVMAQAPTGSDAFGHLMAVEKQLKAERRARAEATESAWDQSKARGSMRPGTANG